MSISVHCINIALVVSERAARCPISSAGGEGRNLLKMELKLEVVLSSSIKRKKPWPRFCWLGLVRRRRNSHTPVKSKLELTSTLVWSRQVMMLKLMCAVCGCVSRTVESLQKNLTCRRRRLFFCWMTSGSVRSTWCLGVPRRRPPNCNPSSPGW